MPVVSKKRESNVGSLFFLCPGVPIVCRSVPNIAARVSAGVDVCGAEVEHGEEDVDKILFRGNARFGKNSYL